MRKPDQYRVKITAVSFVGELVVAHGLLVNRSRRRFVPDGPMARRLVRDLRRGRQTIVIVAAEALVR